MKKIDYLVYHLNKKLRVARKTLVFSKNRVLANSLDNRLDNYKQCLLEAKIFHGMDTYLNVRNHIVQVLWDIRFYKRLGQLDIVSKLNNNY